MPFLGRAAHRAAFALLLLSFSFVLVTSGASSAAVGGSRPAPHRFLQDRTGTTPPTAAASPSAPAAPSLPSGFSDNVVFSGLDNPTNVRSSPDGRVFVVEKNGTLKVFDSLSDPTASVVIDLRTEVDDYWDRGLLGLALDPNFPTNPYIYLLYTYDALPGGTAPRWNDACPTPPGPTTDGCVVTGKLIRIQLSGDVVVGSPQVLISNQWCQQYPSHSIGDL